MTLAVRVVAESSLLQLDREFDFLVPEELKAIVQFGQRVSFRFGRSKTPHTGFISKVLNKSQYATGYIDGLVSTVPVLTQEILDFSRQVADRQCVAIGEILQLAIPDHMARTKVEHSLPSLKIPPSAVTREVVLTGPQIKIGEEFFPSWMELFLRRAKAAREVGHSSILIVPEQADLEAVLRCAVSLAIEVTAWETRQRSARYRTFHSILNQTAIVVGTRSAIYAPVGNLGLVAVADDFDESYREVGSPHTNLRDLALLRATDKSSLLFAAPYRSVELQRLVEIGYLRDATVPFKPLRISFTEHGVRLDDAGYRLAKESLSKGTLLVLLPRKGSSSAVYCATCGERLKCDCGGFVWEPVQGKFSCRLCEKVHFACPACRSTSLRRGRSGSSRTRSEIGKMFPGAAIYEATAEQTPQIESKKNQVVVATPGSAPRLKSGYSGLLILDTDVWLSAQHLRAEQFAIRDWFEAIELLNPEARVVFSGLGSTLGKPLSLGQMSQLAKASFLEAKQLSLPPAVRVAEISGTKEAISKCLAAVQRLGAEVIRTDGSSALIRFSYAKGKSIAAEIRTFATAAKAIKRGPKNVRGFNVVMDSEVF